MRRKCKRCAEPISIAAELAPSRPSVPVTGSYPRSNHDRRAERPQDGVERTVEVLAYVLGQESAGRNRRSPAARSPAAARRQSAAAPAAAMAAGSRARALILLRRQPHAEDAAAALGYLHRSLDPFLK
jgi:hypothetical protein